MGNNTEGEPILGCSNRANCRSQAYCEVVRSVVGDPEVCGPAAHGDLETTAKAGVIARSQSEQIFGIFIDLEVGADQVVETENA